MSTTSKDDATTSRIPPHRFWRSYPAFELDAVRRLELACLLGTFSTTIPIWRVALTGDAAAAVAVALPMKVPNVITYPVDARMSVLLHAALGGSDACALVLSNMLSRMPIEKYLRERLAASWLELTRCGRLGDSTLIHVEGSPTISPCGPGPESEL